MFTLKIETDNDAFAGKTELTHELGRILEKLAREVMDTRLHDGDSFSIRDINGNTVGEAIYCA